MKYLGIGLVTILILLFLVKVNKKKNKVDKNAVNKKEDKKCRKSITQQIRIQVQRNQWNQINIVCKTMEHKKIGEMLTSYTLSGKAGDSSPSCTVHLENILVNRGYRKKGIGTCMIVYLLQEMLKIEQEENCQFRFIYGEIGRGGTDDPHISMPFYKKLDGMSYGKNKKLQYQLKKGQSIDGYDCFYYFLTEIS